MSDGAETAFLNGFVPQPETPETPEPTNPVGRPDGYDPELAELICDHIAAGVTFDKLPKEIDDKKVPSKRTLFRWLRKNEDFAQAYILAKTLRVHALADEILDIVDDSSNDHMLTDGDTPHLVENKETMWRMKGRVEARFKLMARENPRVYGEIQPAPAPPIDPIAASDNAKPVNAVEEKPVLLIDAYPALKDAISEMK